MSRPLLSALALISLVVLGVLILGYFSEFGPGYFHNVAGGSKPHAFQVDLELQRGRVAMYWLVWHKPYPTAPSHFLWREVRFGGPDLRRSLWESDAHSLNTKSGFWVFLLAFPIWCVALPCLIAPLIWLRKRPPSDWTSASWFQGFLGTGGDLAFQANFTSSVPEPATGLLLSSGVFFLMRRRRAMK